MYKQINLKLDMQNKQTKTQRTSDLLWSQESC